MNCLRSKKRFWKLLLILIVYAYIQYCQFSFNRNSRTLRQIKSVQHSRGKYDYQFDEIGFSIKSLINDI